MSIVTGLDVPLPRAIYFGNMPNQSAVATMARMIGAGWVDEMSGSLPGTIATILGLRTYSPATINSDRFLRYRFPSATEITFGLHVHRESGGLSTTQSFLRAENDTPATIVGIRPTDASSGLLDVQLGASGAILGTLPQPLSQFFWQFLEVAVRVDATDGSITVWQNGLQVAHFGPIDTTAGAAGPINRVRLGNPGVATQGSPRYADGYIIEGLVPLGPLLWRRLLPNSDETPQDWARMPANGNNFSAINEVEADFETAFVRSAAPESAARFGLAGISLPEAPLLVHQVTTVRKTETGPDELTMTVHSGTESDTSDGYVIGSPSWQTIGRPLPVDPNTSSPWTSGGVDAAEIEFEHTEGPP